VIQWRSSLLFPTPDSPQSTVVEPSLRNASSSRASKYEHSSARPTNGGVFVFTVTFISVSAFAKPGFQGPRFALTAARCVQHAHTLPDVLDVFKRVLSASDLRLRADNMLCGKRPTYITIVRTAAALDADIILTIYSGSTIPRGTSSDAMCASYTYFPQPPA
jgi:hypothetical protein